MAGFVELSGIMFMQELHELCVIHWVPLEVSAYRVVVFSGTALYPHCVFRLIDVK